MADFLLNWQQLIGSFLGASIPIIGAILGWIWSKYYNRKKYLVSLEAKVVHCINNLKDVRDTVINFKTEKLDELEKNIKARNKNKEHSLDKAYFPLFYVYKLDNILLENSSWDVYLDNHLNELVSMSNDFLEGINDSRYQFRDTIEINQNVALAKLNEYKSHNLQFLQNIQSYSSTLVNTLNTNIKIYIEKLVEALIAIRCLRNKNIVFWHLKFSADFRYFKSYSDYKAYKNKRYERVEKYIKNKSKDKISKLIEKIGITNAS